ncbi:MAG: DUF1015 domain-containing protein [Planctomycetes bacterium]|nr:DUF1015 domain-containing protein [Planctomycetota bacterium]
MARIEPFRGIRFTSPDVSDLIAPPYDILSDKDKKALLAKDDHNIVAVDLPHMPPKTAGPDHVYAQAAGDVTRWIDIRTLRREPKPALYAYHQTYKLGGKTLVRKKFFARLRLEEFGEGSVFPHEQTFGGPKEDRLKLTIATRCNLSPIFGLYPDSENEISGLIDEAIEREPDQSGMLDGVSNKLWVIDDAPTIKSIQVRLADKPIFIADGHHRYGTALMYRQKIMEEMGARPDEDPMNYVLAVLGGMEDPGATIQPYFRTLVQLSHITANALQKALSATFAWKPCPTPANAEALSEVLRAAGPRTIALYMAKDDACALITPKENDPLAALAPDRNPALRQSPYMILHSLLIDRVLQPNLNDGRPVSIHYHKTMEEAIKDARDHEGIACLMPATTMNELRDICLAGELMPQKSTYFFPKLATGMVINPLY